MNIKYLIFILAISNQINIFSAPRKPKLNLEINGGYFAQHKPENLSNDLADFFFQLEQWHTELGGKKLSQSEYDSQVLTFLLKAIEAGYTDELIYALRKTFNKGVLERILEKTDLEQALVEIIGDVEVDLIEKLREFIRKCIEIKLEKLTETEFGQKLENLHEKIDNLPPFIKQNVENLMIKLLENSNHLPENVKEKIKQYAKEHLQERNETSYWDTALSLGSYATAPITYTISYLTEVIFGKN